MTDNPSDKQPAGRYPANFTVAVLPGEIAPYDCDHAEGVCLCGHDWRITWGNLPRKVAARATYVTDSP